ncbi:MAG: TolC family outer membrane protein [Rhodobacteraceae bacterium]|nr:TolC family outer membrane protein [Paracoccaceae bacterium]
MPIGRLKLIIRAGAFALGCLAAPTAWAETLTDAFIAAYKNSNLLEQNRALLRAADEDVVQASTALLPVINFVSSSTFATNLPPTVNSPWSSNLQIAASLTIYDNGATRYATDAAKETVLGLRAALLQVEQQVLLGTVQSYMEMIRAAQFVSLGQSNVRLITQELRAARDRFEVGEVTRTDVSIAEARLAAARGDLAASHGDLEVARETYMAVVGHYPGNLRWPSNPPVQARSEAEAKSVAVRTHPSIDEAQRSVNAAEASIRRAKSAFGLNVSTTASASIDTNFDKSLSGSLTATVPIYHGGSLRSAVRQAVAQRDAARAALLQSVVNVKQDVGIAWANLGVAAARTEASRRQVRASQVAYNGVREEAKFGSRTTLDVLDAEQELLDARSNLISSEIAQYVSLYSLFAAMGLLTSEHLALGIVTYDPIEYYKYANSARGPFHGLSKQGSALDRVLDALGK